MTDAWRDELGDVLFAVFAPAQQTGTTVEEALLGTLANYEQRLAASGEVGSGA